MFPSSYEFIHRLKINVKISLPLMKFTSRRRPHMIFIMLMDILKFKFIISPLVSPSCYFTLPVVYYTEWGESRPWRACHIVKLASKYLSLYSLLCLEKLPFAVGSG